MPSEEPEKGDKVSWAWGSGQPGGTVAEKKTEGEVAITSKRGNKIKKNAEPKNPAVHVERSGNDVVKKASELNVEEKANGSADAGADETEEKNGEKRKHDEIEAEDQKEENEGKKDEPLEENADGKTVKAKESNKKQKKNPAKEEEKREEKEDDAKTEKRKAGRPKKAEGAAKAKKDPTPRATEGIGSRTRSRGQVS